MKTKKSAPRRTRQVQAQLPTPAQISKKRNAIQAGWSTREKQRRRIDAKHPAADARFQAHLRFIQFLVELEAQSE